MLGSLLSVRLPAWLSAYPLVYMFVCQSGCLSAIKAVYFPTFVSVSQPFCLSPSLMAYLTACLPAYLSPYLCQGLHACLFVSLPASSACLLIYDQPS